MDINVNYGTHDFKIFHQEPIVVSINYTLILVSEFERMIPTQSYHR